LDGQTLKDDIMKHVFVLLLLFVVSFSANAGKQFLVVQCENGGTYAFALQSRAVVRFVEDTMLLSSAEELRTFFFDEVSGFEYRDEVSVGDLPVSNALVVYPNPTSDVLFLEHVPSAFVALYGSRGNLLMEQRVTDGSAELDVSGLPSGVYLLRVGERFSFEIVKR